MRKNYVHNKRLYIYSVAIVDDRFLHYPLFHFYGDSDIEDSTDIDSDARNLISSYLLGKINRSFLDIQELVKCYLGDVLLDDLSPDMLKCTYEDFFKVLDDSAKDTLYHVRDELHRFVFYATNGHLVQVHDDYFDFIGSILSVDQLDSLNSRLHLYESFFDVFNRRLNND